MKRPNESQEQAALHAAPDSPKPLAMPIAEPMPIAESHLRFRIAHCCQQLSMRCTARISVMVLAVAVAAADLTSQSSPDAPEAAKVASLELRLASLDTSSTDWALLRDICDKVPQLAADAVPVLQKVIGRASDRDDARYSLRLLGVLARIDDIGVRQLRELTTDERVGVAAMAARVLGRCGSQTLEARSALKEALQAEVRPWVACAIAMGAADAAAVDAAPAILARLQAGELAPEVAQWFVVALSRLSRDTPVATVKSWLRSPIPMAGAGALAARWQSHPPYEQILLKRAPELEGVSWSWAVETLGLCGGESARKFLRQSLDASAAEQAGVVASSRVDSRLLALARLGEPAALEWLVASIAADGRSDVGRPTFEFLSPATARLAELYGKWRCPKSAEVLHARLQADQGSATSRAHAARGLCWQRDTRGLSAAAALLVSPKLRDLERGMGMALVLAQETLHEFVANPDRPDYVIVGDDEQAAVKVGRAWQSWLERKREAIQWREPLPGGDMLLWR
ncbi:MAG: hypothetical protein ACI89X_002343 [Planctomycetota bacterium]